MVEYFFHRFVKGIPIETGFSWNRGVRRPKSFLIQIKSKKYLKWSGKKIIPTTKSEINKIKIIKIQIVIWINTAKTTHNRFFFGIV